MTPELTQEQQDVETTPSSPGPESVRSTPGQMIRRARERARMTPEEFAAQMKLSRSTLEALERDDFKMLVEPVYVRGYYRKCAKILGIAENDMVDAYQALVAPRMPEAPAKLRLASGSELGSGSRLPLALASAAAAIGVVVISIVWFARGEVNHVAAPPAAVTVPVETKTDAAPADAAAPGDATTATPDASTATTTAPATVPSAVAPAVPVTPSAAPAALPAPTAPAVAPVAKPPVAATVPPVGGAQPALSGLAAAAAGSASLALRFNITSWARVDDASGKTLLNGLVRGGERQTLTGTAPFAVFLGNAPGVSVDFNGKPIDLSKYTAQNNTARFTAGP